VRPVTMQRCQAIGDSLYRSPAFTPKISPPEACSTMTKYRPVWGKGATSPNLKKGCGGAVLSRDHRLKITAYHFQEARESKMLSQRSECASMLLSNFKIPHTHTHTVCLSLSRIEQSFFPNSHYY